jgi:hypothetical protein
MKPESETGRISYSKFGLKEVEEGQGKEKTIGLVLDTKAPDSIKEKIGKFLSRQD